jgi:hypothetical protein
MSVAVLLTTRDRPRLLAQSLPQIVREAAAINAPLLIADDFSRSLDTLRLLQPFHARGQVIRRPVRLHYDMGHASLTENWLFGYAQVLGAYPRATHIWKVGDDIVLAEGAGEMLLESLGRMQGRRYKVACLSGLVPQRDAIKLRRQGYLVTRRARHPCVIYDRRVMAAVVRRRRTDCAGLLHRGIDCYLWDRLLPEEFPDFVCGCTPKSVVYHCGLQGGAHSGGDVNLTPYVGSLEGVFVQREP